MRDLACNVENVTSALVVSRLNIASACMMTPKQAKDASCLVAKICPCLGNSEDAAGRSFKKPRYKEQTGNAFLELL